MKSSIRNYLLIHLLIGITCVIVLSATVNYYMNKIAIDHYLDGWLCEMCLSLQTVLAASQQAPDVSLLQTELHDLYEYAPNTEPVQFQLWNDKGKLLIRSALAPMEPYSANHKNGYTTIQLNHESWRVFTNYDAKNHLTLSLAERLNIRNALNHQIIRNNAVIVLLSYPLFGMLIWFVVGHALQTIWRVAREVGQRAPNYLDPVDIHSIPVEIKPLIDELNKLFLRLRQGFEREKAFSANAAHELRTPLAALKTQAQLALRTTNVEERKRALGKLIVGVDRANHVVQQLLTLNRIVPETALHDMVQINLTQLTAEVIADLAPEAIEKNIDIEFIRTGEMYYIKGFLTAINILIRNLIDNAIRYTPTNGSIKIQVKPLEAHVSLMIQDDGPGIPPELRSQVFERFFRVLGTKSSGSGLGLAIVQHIADIHHASVTLGTPVSGRGLEVIVDFSK